MAWTAATRGDYVRASGTYASDVTDREWALIAPHLPAARTGGRPRSTCLRRVVNAVFYLLQTGGQWRMLPRDFPPRSTSRSSRPSGNASKRKPPRDRRNARTLARRAVGRSLRHGTVPCAREPPRSRLEHSKARRRCQER
jgi:transposase